MVMNVLAERIKLSFSKKFAFYYQKNIKVKLDTPSTKCKISFTEVCVSQI